MESTRLSLLAKASDGCDQAWWRLVELYRPFVYNWLRRHDVSHHNAEDLAQDVLEVVVKELPAFSHSGRPGSFRSWLRQITANRAKGFWRAGKIRPAATGRSSMLTMIQQLEDGTSELSRAWDKEHDQHILRQLLVKIEARFGADTLTAFRRQVFDGVPAEQVAEELSMTVVAAYAAKSRVLRRLRQDATALVEDSLFS